MATKKLIDLEPRWLDGGAGIIFDCPAGDGDAVAVWFSNPLPGSQPRQLEPARPRWHREGDDFEHLTLAPSINVVDHWHGWVRNGEVIDA